MYRDELLNHYNQVRQRLYAPNFKTNKKPWHMPEIPLIWWTPEVVYLRDRVKLSKVPSKIRTMMVDLVRQADVQWADILGPSKQPHLVRIRQKFYYTCLNDTNLSTTQIGELCNRDHTTVLYGAASYATRNGLEMPRNSPIKMRYPGEKYAGYCVELGASGDLRGGEALP